MTSRRFQAVIEPMPWGRATYTVIRIPAALAEEWSAAGVSRLCGTIDGVEVDLAITRAPVIDDAFLWAGKSLLRKVGATAGDVVDIELAPADPDEVTVPDDVAEALRDAGVEAAFAALTPGKRRGLLYRVDSAATAATRAKRIAALIDELR
jgi:hypothetical protein